GRRDDDPDVERDRVPVSRKSSEARAAEFAVSSVNDLERGFAGPHEPEPVVLAVGDCRVVAPIADTARGEEDAVELHLICTTAPRDGNPRFGSPDRIPDDDRPEA